MRESAPSYGARDRRPAKIDALSGGSRDVPHLSIERPHHLSQGQAKALAERLARDFEGRFGLAWHWDDDVIHFRRTGVSGSMRVGPATIALELTLGLLLGALKPAIERQINAELDRLTGPEQA
jgi:putative polyhydroxyalkanoate system protein